MVLCGGLKPRIFLGMGQTLAVDDYVPAAVQGKGAGPIMPKAGCCLKHVHIGMLISDVEDEEWVKIPQNGTLPEF